MGLTTWFSTFSRILSEPRNTAVMQVCRHYESAKLPSKKHVGVFEDAAYDLCACLNGSLVLEPGDRKMVSTGISVLIPEGYWAKFHERSGLASKKGIHVLGGVIDSGYSGVWQVILFNSGDSPLVVSHGEAICQFTLERSVSAEIKEITADTFISGAFIRERKEKGFGSTDETTKA